jgi:hypothetical protein
MLDVETRAHDCALQIRPILALILWLAARSSANRLSTWYMILWQSLFVQGMTDSLMIVKDFG